MKNSQHLTLWLEALDCCVSDSQLKLTKYFLAAMTRSIECLFIFSNYPYTAKVFVSIFCHESKAVIANTISSFK